MPVIKHVLLPCKMFINLKVYDINQYKNRQHRYHHRKTYEEYQDQLDRNQFCIIQ